MRTFDVAIVGGGPAGLTAALWSAELGLMAVLIEKTSKFGGQLLQIHNEIANYPGLKVANGRELLDRFMNSLEGREFETVIGVGVSRIDVGERVAYLEDGRSIGWKNLVAATGVRRRKLDIQGEDAFAGKGVLTSGSLEKDKVRGKRVVIVGGGDAALENALILSENASKVTVVHRSTEFRAREEFLRRAGTIPNVDLMTNVTIKTIAGRDNVEAVEVADILTGATRTLATDHVLVRIGVIPNTEWLGGFADLDANGYIKINHRCETSAPGIFACGDVANPSSPTVATAAGSAAIAMKTIR